MTKDKKPLDSEENIEAAGAEETEVLASEDDQHNGEETQEPLEQVEELQEKLEKTHSRLLHTAADLDNLRKRSRREIDDAAIRGRAEVLREILTVIDSIDLALSSADPESKAEGIIEGMKMVRKQFLTATERFELKPVESVGQVFDPNFHEAAAQVHSDKHAIGHVVHEMRKGYVLGKRLLRAAMVTVSKGEQENEPKQEDDFDKTDGPQTADDPTNNHKEGLEQEDLNE